jgi:hypothetical protein
MMIDGGDEKSGLGVNVCFMLGLDIRAYMEQLGGSVARHK